MTTAPAEVPSSDMSAFLMAEPRSRIMLHPLFKLVAEMTVFRHLASVATSLPEMRRILSAVNDAVERYFSMPEVQVPFVSPPPEEEAQLTDSQIDDLIRASIVILIAHVLDFHDHVARMEDAYSAILNACNTDFEQLLFTASINKKIVEDMKSYEPPEKDNDDSTDGSQMQPTMAAVAAAAAMMPMGSSDFFPPGIMPSPAVFAAAAAAAAAVSNQQTSSIVDDIMPPPAVFAAAAAAAAAAANAPNEETQMGDCEYTSDVRPGKRSSELTYFSKPKTKRSNHKPEVTEILKNWIIKHENHPYPDEEQKKLLCELTCLTKEQLDHWFINARRRFLKDRNKEKTSGNGWPGIQNLGSSIFWRTQ